MTHRADQIIDAVAALIETQVQPSGVKVYTHRRFSLAADQDELPAISVDYGEDTAVTHIAHAIDSLLNLEITGVVAASEEADVRAELLRLRREVHKAVMADETQGLAFVVTTTYAGAATPELNVDGGNVVGELTSSWAIYYRMDPSDPGD